MLIRHLSTGVIFLGVLALVSPADAAVCTWVGNTSVNWADANWSGTDNPPLSGDSLVFGASGSFGAYLDRQPA